jgi:hypothetical protein
VLCSKLQLCHVCDNHHFSGELLNLLDWLLFGQAGEHMTVILDALIRMESTLIKSGI